ncbi:MAG: aldose epimerase family protein [Pseudomonadota bacterium]
MKTGGHVATAQRHDFGVLGDGTPIESVVLTNGRGVRARIITYGASLQSLEIPDREGDVADIALGFDQVAGYEAHPCYFGATIGRFANRVANARFSLDGRGYRLSRNDGSSSLHGGAGGFDRKVWRIVEVQGGSPASVRLALTSPDGDQGYPGELEVEVIYSLDDSNTLRIDHRATGLAPTVVNLTNHSLFNLAGEGSARDVLGQSLHIPASRFTPVDSNLIPTGEFRDVANTPFDFRQSRPIGASIRDGRDAQIVVGRGIDHNFVLDAGLTSVTKLAARLTDAISGRALEVWTSEPGLQVYTGNFLSATVLGKAGHLYRMGDGIALEPQKFPDSPNRPAFPSARLEPGETYLHRMEFRLFVAS